MTADGRRTGGGRAAARGPRRIGVAIRDARAASAPETLLAAAQSAWQEAVGERIAAEAWPVAERDRTVTVACRAATWAHELDLLAPTIIARLNSAGEVAARGPVSKLRFTADAARHGDRSR